MARYIALVDGRSGSYGLTVPDLEEKEPWMVAIQGSFVCTVAISRALDFRGAPDRTFYLPTIQGH
jgi:hypothetical protein